MKSNHWKLLLLLLTSIANNTTSQNWQPLQSGTDWPVHGMHGDSSTGILYIVGRFETAGSVTVNSITSWDGQHFRSLDGGVQGCITSCPLTFSVSSFKGEMVCSPSAWYVGEEEIFGAARWDGEDWHSLSQGVTSFLGDRGIVWDYLEQGDSLFLFGSFQQVDTDTAYCAALWDGDSITGLGFPYVPQPQFGWLGTIRAAVEYNDRIYVGGNFREKLGIENTLDFAWFDGENWGLPTARVKGAADDIICMEVYKDQIYVGGTFGVSSGNSGNSIMVYEDGEFKDVAGGLASEDNIVIDMLVRNDKLFLFGRFNTVGGVPAQNIASWDGEKWCGYDFTFDNNIETATLLGDTLFIGGAFGNINGQPYNHLAYWKGELTPAVCSEPIANTGDLLGRSISISPNPATDHLQIQLPSLSTSAALTIQNLQGQALYQNRLQLSPTLQTHEIQVAGWPAGVYVLRVQSGERQWVRKFVVE